MTSSSPSLRPGDGAGQSRASPWLWGRFVVFALTAVALLAAHLLTGGPGQPPVPLWSPAAGLALVLTAWFSGRGALVAAAVSLAVHGNLLVATLDGLEAFVAWRLYTLAHGNRRLDDPHSAIVFLLVAPGLAAAASALMRVALVPPTGTETAAAPFVPVLGRLWISRALGILTLAPPLLVVLTPSLARRGLIPPTQEPHRAPSERPGLRGWIEVLLLGAGTGGYGLLLVLAVGRTEPAAWQVWGVPLIFIVWSSFRHGLVGGTVTAALATVLPLAAAQVVWPADGAHALLACNFVAQCSTALLAAVSAGAIRASEARYRRVVGHIPVLLYSARIVGRNVPTLPAAEAGSDNGPRTPRRNRRFSPPIPEVEVTFVSPACPGLLGCPPEDLLGPYSTWLKHVDPRDREVLLAAIVQVGRQQQPVTCEYRLAPDEFAPEPNPPSARHTAPVITLQGPAARQRWVRDTLAPSFRSDGSLEGWEGVVTEITEQRNLADDLRRTTSMFHGLVANLPAGVFFVQGAAGRPILVNARARHLLGQREDSAAGLEHLPGVYRLHRPDGSPYPADELPVAMALRRGLTSMRDDIVVHRPDGRRLPLVTWAAPVDLSGQGSADAAVWVFEDLTTLRQAEAARQETLHGLRASEERYRGLVESLPLALIQFDAEGRVSYVNPAGETLTGHRLAGGLTAAFFAIDPHGEPRQEVRFRTRSGEERIVYALLQPNGPDLTALLVDMTRERRLEQELRRAQRLELVGRLAGGIAHDFNNLLTVILTLAELIRGKLPEGHPALDDVARMDEAATHAAQLAAQLLAFSKQRRSVARRVSLNAVVRRTLDLVRTTLPPHIEVATELSPEELAVLGDEPQLVQVLMNLCLNARDAMAPNPAGGRLIVRTEASENGSPKWAKVSVCDSGAGMTDEVRQRIFEPFFSTKERGTGLGLAVVKQVVEQHGGWVDVWSRPGEGSQFHVCLPLAEG